MMNTRVLSRLALAGTLSLCLSAGGALLHAQAPSGRKTVLVELQQDSGAVAYAIALERSGTRNAAALAAAATAGRRQLNVVAAEQQRVGAALASVAINARERFRVQRVMNAIAVTVDAANLAALRRLPGVKAIHPLELEYPTSSKNITFTRAPTLWDPIGFGLHVTGTGIRIGIIDTGVDYQHPTFGGSGLLADYQANDRTAAPDSFFPTAKVVGGWDFVGDAYDGGNTPTPDPDPMDCNGHGTHVAGLAAGFGVNSDGTTYRGSYDEQTPFASLRIVPGTAPQAQIYALRVFGCTGGTEQTVQAIDWAMDPNQDNDLSDHLDVINLSLGSPFGGLTDGTSIAADNAARAGVIVVASAGNHADTFFISGSPGSGDRVIATAGSVDNGVAGHGLTVNAPAGIAQTYKAGHARFGGAEPDAGVTGSVVVAVGPADACSPVTNAAAIAGHIALLDPGGCAFTTAVKNAQDAGAIGAILSSDTESIGDMGGTDPTITIPSVLVPLSLADSFKTNIATLNVTMVNDRDTLYEFTSRGPRGGGSRTVLKPDIAAPGSFIDSAQSGVTCTSGDCARPDPSGFVPGGQSLTSSGTSMASPHVAGIMALLRQLHPSWSVEELKALVMNTALHDVTTLPGPSTAYGPTRIGAGRVDASLAGTASVVAFNAEEPGLVSLSFDGDVRGTVTRQKKLRIVNHGTTAQTYDLAIDVPVDAPGVSFSTPGRTTVTVPPAQSVELIVQMDADAALMRRAPDPTLALTQTVFAPPELASFGAQPRQYLTEEAGYLTFRQSGVTKLRVPLYSAPAPVADMHATTTIATGGSVTGSTTIPLSGTGVCTGTLAGTTCTHAAQDVVSLVTPFELQVSSPRDPTLQASADLQYVGVGYSPTFDEISFGVSTWAPWHSPTDVAFDIYIDCGVYTLGADADSDTCTGPPDGVDDLVLFNSNTGSLSDSRIENDVFVSGIYVILRGSSFVGSTPAFLNRAAATDADTRVFNTQVAMITAPRARLKIGGQFTWHVQSCPGYEPVCQLTGGYHFDEAVTHAWDYTAPGLDFGGTDLNADLPGVTLPVTFNTSIMASEHSPGALLLHFHNAEGARAEPVLLDTGAQTDLGVTLTADTTTPMVGQPVTFTIQVQNHGPQFAAGVQVAFESPLNFSYISDTGSGFYDSGSGIWNIGGLAVGESRTLQIVASPQMNSSVDARATIFAIQPADPITGNNVSTLGVMTAGQSDLAITTTAPSSSLVDAPAPFTVTLRNTGVDPAYNVVVANTIAAGSGTTPSGTASAGLFDAATGQWHLASLAPGAQETLTVNVLARRAPLFTLQSQATTSTNESTLNNNTSTASMTVQTRPSTTTAADATASTSGIDQPVVLTATVASSLTVDAGIVTFTVRDAANAIVGTPVSSAPLTNGTASATYTLPGGIAQQTLHLTAAFTDGTRFGPSSDTTKTLTVAQPATRTYTLAEGATSAFFQTRILLANPSAAAAPITLTFAKDDGTTVTANRTLPPMSRSTVVVSEIPGLESGAMSTTVTSTTGLPLSVERTMQWGATGYGAHTEKAEEGGNTNWYFAEGSQGFFSTFLLLMNPQTTTNTAHITYLREGQPPLSRDYPVAAGTRYTVDLAAEPALANSSFGVRVQFDQPGFAERSTYFGTNPFWKGGTASAGARALAQTWWFAEGATGNYFMTFLLIANPNVETANVTVTYLPVNSPAVVKTYPVAGGQRLTLNVANEDPSLASSAVGMRVDADRPIVAERAQYWPQPTWIEGHSSTGMTVTGLRWGLAEGAVGGVERAWQTYILLLNQSDVDATVTVTFLREVGTPVVKTFTVAPHARRNIWIGGPGSDVPELADENFGTLLESTQPIVVERSMYGNADGITWAIGTNATAAPLPPSP